ncbi:LytR C-terminal domain-containing protein [Pseudonocardia sp. GCM10023141]|uniref:LytR C-terminal domain-containing protein n=1 Tax=Pseudonocardia sp. GCM10023141 TaxID=3252653 RepID=UPI00360C6236
MTAPAPSGGSSPLRIGGLALIGVGVIAGLVGLGTLATSGGAPGVAAPAATSTAAAPADQPPPAAAPAPTGDAAVPVPSFGPTPTNAIAAPPTTTSAPAPAAGGNDGSFTRAPVRVYNNSTISGLAARAADDFRAAGWPVEQVANYPQGIIPTTTVYYRPGTDEQAAATALGGQFGMRVEPRFEGLTEASPGLIVIVTNNFQGR